MLVRMSHKFIYWQVLSAMCFVISGCKEDRFLKGEPAQAATGGVPASPGISGLAPRQSDVDARAQHIRSRIEKFKEWGGGHSPIPRRAINSNTFTKIRQEIAASDVPALLILVQDDGYDIRSLAASLLECVDPNAESAIESQLKQETGNDRRSRLMDAQIAIGAIRAGGTSCK